MIERLVFESSRGMGRGVKCRGFGGGLFQFVEIQSAYCLCRQIALECFNLSNFSSIHTIYEFSDIISIVNCH